MNKYLSKILIFTALLFYQVTGFAAPPPKDVNVLSMPPVDATVSGTVDANITNTPTVDAQQSGEWNVNINGVPGVTIENGPLEPVPVEITNQTITGELINIPLGGQFAQGSSSLAVWGPVPKIYQVPSGKKLIVKHVSCYVPVKIGSEVGFRLETRLSNTLDQNAYQATASFLTAYPILLEKRYLFIGSGSSADYYAADHPISFVVGGSTNNGVIELMGIRSDSSGGAYGARCNLTGELRPVNQ